MLIKTKYYYIYEHRMSKPYDSLDEIQAAIAMSGVPHHIKGLISVAQNNFGEIQKVNHHDIWYSNWRSLQLAKNKHNKEAKDSYDG